MTPCDVSFVTDFPFGLFADLSEDRRTALVELMAGASEKAYRRGFQQGHYAACTDDESAINSTSEIFNWRYSNCLGESPYPPVTMGGCNPVKGGGLASERLEIECGDWLRHIFGEVPAGNRRTSLEHGAKHITYVEFRIVEPS